MSLFLRCICGDEKQCHKLVPSLSKCAPNSRHEVCDIRGCHCKNFIPANVVYRNDILCSDCGNFPRCCKCEGGLLIKYHKQEELWERFPPNSLPTDKELDRALVYKEHTNE